MTPPQKPEWMELADADSAPTAKKSTRLIPALIASVALAILGVGAIATQVGDEAPASASEKVTPAASSALVSLAQSTPVATITVNSTSPAPKESKSNSVSPKQPSIASLPSGGGNDDGRGDKTEHEGNDD
jgi:cell division septation protein DedD